MAITGIKVNQITTEVPEASNAYQKMVYDTFGDTGLYQPQEDPNLYKPADDYIGLNPQQLESNRNPTFQSKSPYRDIIYKYSQKYGIDPDLVEAVIRQESGGNRKAISPKGAKGVMQLMDPTSAEIARKMGKTNYNIYDPETNIEMGVYYLAQKYKKYNGNVELTLAGYNAGDGNVSKYGGVPPFKETRKYVKNITYHYNIIKETKKDMEAMQLFEYNINGQNAIVSTRMARQLMEANEQMMKETGKGLIINSSYRSFTQQKDIWERSEGGKKFVAAKPGHSNHQTGSAVDIQNHKEAQPYLRKVGLINPIKNDPVHYSETGR